MQGLLVIVLGLSVAFALWHELRERRRNRDNAHRNAISRAVAAQEAEAELEQSRQAEWEQWINEQEQAKADLIDFAVQHERTLLTKQRQLTYTDDYGRVDRSAFIKELEYFVEKVVPAD